MILLVSYSNTITINSCDTLSDILYQHATDFKQLVDIKILALVLFQNALLTQQDMEYLQLTTIIESKKVDHVYLKMVRLGEEGYKKFLSCLKDPYASQHDGHIKLYDILLTPQQEIQQYQTTEPSGYFTSKRFKMHG